MGVKRAAKSMCVKLRSVLVRRYEIDAEMEGDFIDLARREAHYKKKL